MLYRPIATIVIAVVAALILGACATPSATDKPTLADIEKDIEGDLARAGEKEPRIICRKEQRTGSHRIHTVCYRHSVKEELARQEREKFRRMNRADSDICFSGGAGECTQ